MLWRLVQEIGMETNQQMNYLSYEFFKVLYGTSEPQPRHKLDEPGFLNEFETIFSLDQMEILCQQSQQLPRICRQFEIHSQIVR